MKKVFAIALAALMLTACCVLPSFAAGTGTEEDPYTVQKGTPNVDGVLDDMYRTSYSLSLSDSDRFYPIGANGTDTAGADGNTVNARSYILWDYSYLYICTMVYENTIYTRGQTWVDLEEEPWQNDCVEFWIGQAGFEWKNTLDAFGYAFSTGNGVASFSYEDAVYYTTVNQDEGYYVTEMALPLRDIDEGLKLTTCLQVNSIDSTENGGAWQSNQGKRDYVILSAEESAGAASNGEVTTRVTEEITTKKTPAAEDPNVTTKDGDNVTTAGDNKVTTGKKDEATTPKADDNGSSNEKSGCGSVVGTSAVLMLLSVAAIPVIASKKRK